MLVWYDLITTCVAVAVDEWNVDEFRGEKRKRHVVDFEPIWRSQSTRKDKHKSRKSAKHQGFHRVISF
jgi:hypothetical protein